MYVIKCGNYYFQKDHSKVIVFEDEKDAYSFKDTFYQMSVTHFATPMMMFGDNSILKDIEECKKITKVIPIPENFDRQTVNYNTMR